MHFMNRSITATPKFNRWVPVAASIAIQLCMGTAYIWSVFQSYLIQPTTPDALFNWPASYGTLAIHCFGLLTVGSTIEETAGKDGTRVWLSQPSRAWSGFLWSDLFPASATVFG